MTRRRALLSVAASSGGTDGSDTLPPESTTFAFPLYLNATEKVEEGDNFTEFERVSDDISRAFYEWCKNNHEGDGLGGGNTSYVNITDETPIYINGLRVISGIWEISDVIFYFEEQSVSADLYEDGGLYFYVLK